MKLFENMPIHRGYNAIVYISGIILVLSIFVDVKVWNNTKMMYISGITFLYGSFLWISRDSLLVYDKDNIPDSSRYSAINRWHSMKSFLTLTYLLIMFVTIFYEQINNLF